MNVLPSGIVPRPRSALMNSGLLFAIATLGLLSSTSIAWSCDFCGAPGMTLGEQVSQSDVVVLVQWHGGTRGSASAGSLGTTLYKVVTVAQDGTGKLAAGTVIAVDRYRSGQGGDLTLLLGNDTDGRIEWVGSLPVTKASFQYITEAPRRELPTEVRLAYFVRFLEFPEEMVAADAFGEFANAPTVDVAKISGLIPREKVRQWLMEKSVTQTRIGLYGLLLGLAGNPDDAEFLKQIIARPVQANEFRLGIDGTMAGYLLLAQSEGLKFLCETKLADTSAPMSEIFAALQALRFMWSAGGERIPRGEMQAAMRLLLARPNLADLVIIDLARWQDWTAIPQLMELYDNPEYNVPQIKKAIVRFLMVAVKQNSAGQSPDSLPPDSLRIAEQAQTCLSRLREQDPQTVAAAERLHFD